MTDRNSTLSPIDVVHCSMNKSRCLQFVRFVEVENVTVYNGLLGHLVQFLLFWLFFFIERLDFLF